MAKRTKSLLPIKKRPKIQNNRPKKRPKVCLKTDLKQTPRPKKNTSR